MINDCTDTTNKKSQIYDDIKNGPNFMPTRTGSKVYLCGLLVYVNSVNESNRKAMNRNWGNQKANPALKTKTGNKYYKQKKIQ